MTRKFLGSFAVALALLFVASAPSLAESGHKLRVPNPIVLDGKTIAPGDYQVTWESHGARATVAFSRNNDVVATGEGRVVDRGKTYDANAMVSDTRPDGSQVLTEMRFAGSSQAIIFGETAPTSMHTAPNDRGSLAASASSAKDLSPAPASRIRFVGKPTVKRPAQPLDFYDQMLLIWTPQIGGEHLPLMPAGGRDRATW